MNKLLLLHSILLLSMPVFGQLNLKAGYCLSFLDAPEHDAVIEMYNASQGSTLTNPFKSLDLLHGLDLGIEYHWESFALEAGWRTKRNRQESTGLQSQQSFKNKLTWSMSSFYGGIVQYLGPIRISASLDYNYTRTKLDFDKPAILNTLKDTGWGSTFSLGYVLNGSGGISLVFAPYAQFNWAKYDLSQLQATLLEFVDSAQTEDYFNYGFTLYFLNGPR